MLSILDNVTSLIAENGLSSTQAALQKTLTELATGLRINSGADDAARLSIVDGLHANIAALTQSSQNALMGIGALQTSDGALSNVSLLLERAVTLATEAANGGLSSEQSHALDAEYQSILSEVDRIGGATTFNGENVFGSAGTTTYSSTQASLSASTGLTAGSITTVQDAKTGGTFQIQGDFRLHDSRPRSRHSLCSVNGNLERRYRGLHRKRSSRHCDDHAGGNIAGL